MRKLLSSVLAVSFLFLAGPLSSQASTLEVKFTKLGSDGSLHPSLSYFQLEFSGSEIASTTNCASFLNSQGVNLHASLRVPGKPSEVSSSLVESLRKTVSVTRTTLTCDFFVEGWGRTLFYQEPIGDFFSGLPSIKGALSINDSTKTLATSEPSIVDFDNPANHPKLSFISPQRLEVIGQNFIATLVEESSPLWEFDSARAEICDMSENCENPKATLSASESSGIWSGGKSMAVMLSRTRILVSSPIGQKQITVGYFYKTNAFPSEYFPSCSSVYAASCVYAKTTVLYDAVSAKAPSLQAREVTNIKDVQRSLSLLCPKSISGKSFKCTVGYNAYLGAFPVVDSKAVTFCAWKDWDDYYDPEDCSNQEGSKPAIRISKSVASGAKVEFSIPASAYRSFTTLNVLATAPSSAIATADFVRPAKPTKQLKTLEVRVNTSAEVVFGETHSFRISTNPAVTGACRVYRANNGFLNLVATTTLKNGVSSGAHRWLWSTPGSTVLSLTVECSSTTHAGTGYAIVKAFR